MKTFCQRRGFVMLALAGFISCTPPAEYPLLEQFFLASRMRDLTALHNIATVVFEPRDQGVVTEFTITNVDRRRVNGHESKEVTVQAPVRALTGAVMRKRLLLTVEPVDGRWKVTSVRPGGE
jgi:hypothetical protein